MIAPSVGAMMDGEHASATSGGTAWRRRQRRLRALRRFILWSTKMEVAAALHHTARQRTRLADDATQTTSACDRSAPVFDYIVPPPVNLNIASPPAAACAATATLSPVIEYVAPAPTVFHATTAPVIKYVAPALADTYPAPAPGIEYVAPAPAVHLYSAFSCD